MDMTRHYHDLYGDESKDQKIKRLYAEIERLREALENLLTEAEDVFVCMADATGIDRHNLFRSPFRPSTKGQ